MPALSGEPWRSLSKVQLVTTATGLGRYWTLSVDDVAPITATGDQSTWEFQGDTVAVTLRVEWAADVGNVIGAPDTINVQVRTPSGFTIGSTWTFAPVGDSGSQTRTLHFDLDPLNQSLDVAANRRWGTLELYLQVIDDPGGTTSDYTLDSRGTASVGPPALTTYSWARGYVRQRATIASTVLSNVSLGGAEPASWAYPDPIHIQATTTVPPYDSNLGSGRFSLRRPQAQGGALERDDSTGNITSATASRSLTSTDSSSADNAIGLGMFLGSEAKDFDYTLPTSDFGGDNLYAWATSGHPAGYSTVSTQVLRYVGRITVDPRITFGHLFQLNDPAYGTPPLSKDVSPATRLSTDFGFISERATNARSEGLNGVTWTTKLWDNGELSGSESSPTKSRSGASATAGGQSGWGATLLVWDSQIPGGTWNKKVVITSPSNATTLETSNTATLTLIASDPRIVLNLAAGDPGAPGTHWQAGRQLVVGARLFQEFYPVSCDAGTGLVSILRFNAATARLQHLSSVSPATWTDIANGTNVTTFAMTASPGDSDIQLKSFSAVQTADFGTNDLFLIGQLKRTGAPYQTFQTMDAVGNFFRHDIAAAIGSIAESSILFDGTSGHDHTGSTSGRAIGDRA